MAINPSFKEQKRNQAAEALHHFEEVHKEDLAAITPEERARAFREWAKSHDRKTPLLSDYAVSRESMYDDECL